VISRRQLITILEEKIKVYKERGENADLGWGLIDLCFADELEEMRAKVLGIPFKSVWVGKRG